MSEYIFVTNIFEYSNIRIHSSHSGIHMQISLSPLIAGNSKDSTLSQSLSWRFDAHSGQIAALEVSLRWDLRRKVISLSNSNLRGGFSFKLAKIHIVNLCSSSIDQKFDFKCGKSSLHFYNTQCYSRAEHTHSHPSVRWLVTILTFGLKDHGMWVCFFKVYFWIVPGIRSF